MSDYCLIPVLSSQAGSCLTFENWQQAGATHGVYSLEALLTKPGMGVLQGFRNLRHYTAWPGKIILNACLPPLAATGDYLVRSPYDGSKITISNDVLLALIHHLQADYVIWPTADLEEALCADKTHQCLVPGLNHFPDGTSLFYGTHDESLDEWTSHISHDASLSLWLESDKPAADALLGTIYHHQGAYHLLALDYQDDFLPLDETCSCLTCKEGYTRAYLHHLLQHTPLLAQRFLILHNYNFRSRCLMNLGGQ